MPHQKNSYLARFEKAVWPTSFSFGNPRLLNALAEELGIPLTHPNDIGLLLEKCKEKDEANINAHH